MRKKLPERRRFVRIEVPLKVVIKTDEGVDEVVARNISPIGLNFEIGRELKESEKTGKLEMFLYLPLTDDPIRLEGKVIWWAKKSLEDNAPYDVGVEITSIDEGSKKLFLKYLCDLLYRTTYSIRV